MSAPQELHQSPSGSGMRQRYRSPVMDVWAGHRDSVCLDRRTEPAGQRCIQPESISREPHPSPPLHCPSLRAHCFQALPLALLVRFEHHLLPPRWRPWGGPALSSQSCCLHPPLLLLFVSVSARPPPQPGLCPFCLLGQLGASGYFLGSPETPTPSSSGLPGESVGRM